MDRHSAYSIAEIDKQLADSIETSFQVALLGDTQVGKTSILNQFVDRTFNENVESTRGIDMRFCKLNLEKYLVKLRMWDSFGEDVFKSIRQNRLKNIDAVMLVFDLTDEVTLENLMMWNDEVDKHADSRHALSKILIGNKSDLPHSSKITHDAKAFAARHEMMYFETSAKLNHLILDSFVYLIKDLLKEKQIVRTERATQLEQEAPRCNCNCFR